MYVWSKTEELTELIVDILLLDDPLEGFRYQKTLPRDRNATYHLEMDNFSDREILSNIFDASKVHKTEFRFYCFCDSCDFKHNSLIGHIAREQFSVLVYGQNEALVKLLTKFRVRYTSLKLEAR